jgi:poly(A) polymerase
MKFATLLIERGIPVHLGCYTALDRYLRNPPSSVRFLTVEAELAEAARFLPELSFPGSEQADALLVDDGATVYLRFVERLAAARRHPVSVLNLYYNLSRDRYLDPFDVYDELKKKDPLIAGRLSAPDAAVLASRYEYDLPAGGPAVQPWQADGSLKPFEQRDLLSLVLTGRDPARGLSLLMDSGFIKAEWPELFGLLDVSHSKEYHPEGDAWDHTLETFRYRKNPDLGISLALLLHDAGKAEAGTSHGRRFDQHAEIGTRIAGNFLQRLEFPEALRADTLFLVRNHMLPGLLEQLPVYRTERVMSSELFPRLLEVYRCDLSSTFRGPDGYYEACKIYQAFLRHRKNPYRKNNGDKLARAKSFRG